MIKKYFVILILLSLIFCSAYKKPYKYTINSEKNAFYHNNLGINHLQDRVYYAAIQEFKIAISLSPSTQASAVFYNNLGETYNFIGYPDMAKDCFEQAIKLYGLNFKYYLNLAKTYHLLGITNKKIRSLSSSTNPYDRILLGLLYINKNNVREGVNILDELCTQEQDLLIIPSVKQYIADVLKNNE